MDRWQILIRIAIATTPFLVGFNAKAATSLDEIVNPGMLGKTLKYAEFKIGSPAMREITDGLGIQRNVYELNGCTVSIGVSNNQVASVGLTRTQAKDAISM